VTVRNTRNTFWTKNVEVAKFSILDEKQISHFWTKNGQLVAQKVFNIHTLALP